MVLASQMSRSEMTRRGMSSSRSRMPKWLWVTVAIFAIAAAGVAWWMYSPAATSKANADTATNPPKPAAPVVPTVRDGAWTHSTSTTDSTSHTATASTSIAATTATPASPASTPTVPAASAITAPPAAAPKTPTAPGAATPAASNSPTARPAGSAFAKGMQLIDSGSIVEGRQMLSDLLDASSTSAADAAAIRDALGRANQSALFGPRPVANDPFTEIITVQRGENLTKIAKRYHVPYQALEMINGIDSRRLQVDQKIKVIKGPFHAEVNKSAYRIDLYLHGTDGKRVFARSFSVGLGEANSTPTGNFMIKQGGKVEGGGWTNPRTGETFAPGDPKNPIGKYWMTLQGIDDKTQTIRGYGIHGTIAPDSIGKQMSMGCVRLADEDIATLYKLMTDGQSTVHIAP